MWEPTIPGFAVIRLKCTRSWFRLLTQFMNPNGFVPSTRSRDSWRASCWSEIQPRRLSLLPPPGRAAPSLIVRYARYTAPPANQAAVSRRRRGSEGRFLPTDTHSFLSLTLVGLHLVLQLVHQVLQSDVVLLIFLRLKGVKPLSFLIFTTRTCSVAKAQHCRGIT